MFTIASRYILKRLLATFLIISPIVIFVAWIVLSVKYVTMIVYDSISFFTFMKIVLCISPGICGTILPICFLISSILTIHTLQANKEIIILLTSGKSPLSLLAPLLFLGCCVSAAMLFLNTTGAPYAYKTFESLKEQNTTSMTTNFLKEHSFNVIGNAVIYIGARERNTLKNIFISYVPKNMHTHTNSYTNIITAKCGALDFEDKKAFIRLENGYRQELDKNNDVVATLTFDSLTYDVTYLFEKFYEKSSKVKFKTQAELMQDYRESANKEHRKNCLVEYHSRVLTSFISLISAIIVGILMLGIQGRGAGMRSAIAAFIWGVIGYADIMVLVRSPTMLPYNYWILCAISAILFLTFIQKRT